jgi:hypothetical protein
MIVGSGFATFAITEMANFCTTDNPFEPTTLANNTNQLFVFAFSPKSISRPCKLNRHQDAARSTLAATISAFLGGAASRALEATPNRAVRWSMVGPSARLQLRLDGF